MREKIVRVFIVSRSGTKFLFTLILFTVIARPLFSLNEHRSLQMKQEIILQIVETNHELGYACFVTDCSIVDVEGRILVDIKYLAEKGGIRTSQRIIFTISEVYYGFHSIRQKIVISQPLLPFKGIVQPHYKGKYDKNTKGTETRFPKRVYIEVPGGGGSGHKVSIYDSPSLKGTAMLMQGIAVATIDYRPLLEYDAEIEMPLENRKRIAFVWDQYEDLMLANKKLKEMHFEVKGTFGHSYGAYLCSIIETKSPGCQGRLFLGAGIYDVFSVSEYWYHWFGEYLPHEALISEWSPGNAKANGDKVFIACPVFDSTVSPTHSFWLKIKWPNAFLKEYPAGHLFFEVEKELSVDVINWILYQ